MTENPTPVGPTHVVGIGTSAEGLDDLERLLAAIPARTAMAFVVVQSLSAEPPNPMADRLGRNTSIPVNAVRHGIKLEPDSIYLVPPGKEVIVTAGQLLLTDERAGSGLHAPIDQFLRSLANDLGNRAIAVVLSGKGRDGTPGVEHIHRAGGRVVAQKPDSARFDGMPRSAIASGHVDDTLVPEAIPAALVGFREGALRDERVSAHEVPPSLAENDRLIEINKELQRKIEELSTANIEHQRKIAELSDLTQRDIAANLAPFKHLSDQAREAYLLIDEAGAILYANKAAGRLLGESADDLCGRAAETIHPSLGPARTTEILRRGEGPLSLDLDVLGRTVPVDATVASVSFERTTCVHVVLRDVRARRQAERRVATEHAVSRLLATSDDWGTVLPRVLDAFLEHLGADVADYWTRPDARSPLQAQTIRTGARISPEQADRWRAATGAMRIDPLRADGPLLGRAWRSRRPTWMRDPAHEESFVRRKAAAALRLRTGLAIPVLCGSECIGILGLYTRSSVGDDNVVSDMLATIGRQLGSFAASAENRAQLRLRDRAIAAATDGILITDPRTDDNPIVYVNEGFQRLTGYTAEEAIGRNCRFLQGSRTSRRVLRRLREAIGRGEEFSGSLVNYRKDGKPFWNHLDITPVHDERGELTHFVGIQHDVSQERQIRNELRAARKAADASNEAKSAFLANMSHEIRTPMTAILGFTEVLHSRLEDEELQKTTAAIKRNGRHLLGIIDDILDLSKIEAGKLEIRVRPTPLPPLLWEVRSMMSARAIERGIDLRLRYATPVPESILTDPAKVRQILVNVVGNAIKFTEAGHVEIVVRYAEAKETLSIEVRDTGVGMSEEIQKRLFAPFAQASRDVADRFGGTGLGLSITRRLLDHLGGDVEVESALGSGTTFTLHIPAGSRGDAALVVPDADEAPEDAEIAPWSPPRRLDCRVLVVDDQPDVRQVVEYYLRAAGASVEMATNGREAVERVTAAARAGSPFDAVVLDMQMPVMSGYQATRALRADGFDVPIIALTAAAMKGERNRCLRAGCDDYLSKPLNGSALVTAVAERVPSRTSEEGEPESEPGARKVLLVDDSLDSAEALSELLQMWGHRVEIAGTAGDAERIFQGYQPDVVVSDIQLPDESGDALVVRLRAQQHGSVARMVALSGRSEPEDIRRSLDAGFHDYLVKPVGAEELRQAIERAPSGGAGGPAKAR